MTPLPILFLLAAVLLPASDLLTIDRKDQAIVSAAHAWISGTAVHPSAIVSLEWENQDGLRGLIPAASRWRTR